MFFFFEGIHWTLYCRNGAQDHCFGPILLFSDRMEYFRWNHCYLKLNGNALGECAWQVCPQIIQTGKSAKHILVKMKRKMRCDPLHLSVLLFVFNS